MAIPTIVEMSFCMDIVCFLRRSISESTISMFLAREKHPEHCCWPGLAAGWGAEDGIATEGEGVAVGLELDPVEAVEGGGPSGADGIVAAAGELVGGDGQVEVEAGGGGPAGAGVWYEGKYCMICWVLMPSSRSRSRSERKVIDSSFFFKLESRLVILVWAKFSCIFRYSLLAASGVTAGAFLGLLFGGGAGAVALGGAARAPEGGAAGPEGGAGGPEGGGAVPGRAAGKEGAWRNTFGMCMGLGGLDEDEEVGAWREGVDRGAWVGWAMRDVRLLKAGSLLAEVYSRAETELVVRTHEGTEKVRDTVDNDEEGAAVISEAMGFEVWVGESSRISKIEVSSEEVSEAFLFILVTSRGLAGVPVQLCCL